MTYQGSSGKLKRSPSMNSLSNTNKDNGSENCIEISGSIITNNEINQEDDEQLGNSNILNSILKYLPDKYNDDLLKEKDNFITTNQDIHILDKASLFDMCIFLQNNNNIDYMFDVISSVLMNNKKIPFNRLKDCFGYDFKENIKSHINQTTKEKLENFNKSLLTRNIQYLNAMKYRNTRELKQKQPIELLKIIFELNKQNYLNKSTLEHLHNTLNSTICMPELEIDFLIEELPNINIPNSELEKFIKNRYNNYNTKSQVPIEKLLKLNKLLLVDNIMELQQKVIENKNKILDRETLNLLTNDELSFIRNNLITRTNLTQVIKKDYYNNFPDLQKVVNNKLTLDRAQEIKKTELISSIQQLSQYATDKEFKLITSAINTDKEHCYDTNILEQSNVKTLQQINNNLLVYKFMEQQYCNYLIGENGSYLQIYKKLLDSARDFEESKVTLKQVV